MELWSALSYQSQDYSSATHVRVGSSQVSQRDVLVNAGVGGLIASAESQDQELLIIDTQANESGEESEDQAQEIDQSVRFEYSIKLINPRKMSEFKNVRVCKWKRCKNMNNLRDFLGSKVPPVDIGGEKPDFTEVDIGYIEPGHGLKGRKQWINIDDDVDVMYSTLVF